MTDKEQIFRNIRNQLRRSQETNLSPCVGVCVIKHGFCTGCYRTLGEIAAWRTMPDEEKLHVIKQLEDRVNAEA